MKRNGFSLIELMIVIAIIALLAMIAIPNYSRFLAKAKRTEAYANLNALYAAEKAYWAEHGKYSNVLMGTNGIGWKPEGAHNYTYGFAGAEGSNYFSGKMGNGGNNLQGSRADQNGFVAVASADIDGDGKADIITIDQNHTITIVQDDLAD